MAAAQTQLAGLAVTPSAPAPASPELASPAPAAESAPGALEIWAMDEHRIGLKPILRTVWAACGQRPLAVVRPRYEWLYLYGFVQPQSGRTYWLLMPTVSIEAFSAALAAFAIHVDAGPRRRILLVLDRAGWHVSPRLVLPAGVTLVPLPPYSPELQPAERLWPLTNEALANRYFATLSDLDQAQGRRCVALQDDPETVRGCVHYHWWPKVA
mgnify:FL=1